MPFLKKLPPQSCAPPHVQLTEVRTDTAIPVEVDTNPAFLTLIGAKRVLLLQGPVGPFFDRLSRWLIRRGTDVQRVVFQSGDQHDCRAVTPIHYVDEPSRWRPYICAILDKQLTDCLVLFGQARFYHRIAIEAARDRGIQVVVMEEGYFRPGFITMELDGVNGYSRTLENFIWSERAPSIQPDQCALHFQKTAFHAARHYWLMWLFKSHFPHYRHHRTTDPFHYAAYWLRSWGRKLIHRRANRLEQAQLFSSAARYFFVPLQHDGDSQITHHSPFDNIRAFVDEVMRSFAEHAPKNTLLVFRQHPHSRGGPGHAGAIASLAHELGISDRVRHLVEGDTPDLAQRSLGVVLINSTVGLQAMELGAPLMVMGDAMYDRPALTHSGDLASFWHGATAGVPELRRAFLLQMKNLTQMPCSVYEMPSCPLHWPATSS